MTKFTSVVFNDPAACGDLKDVPQPDFFADLHLDQVIAAVADGKTHLVPLFHVPLHDVSAIVYRHEIFRDLERDEIRAPIESFVSDMATMRQRLDRATHLWHPLQQQGWFVYAVESFCETVAGLRDHFGQVDLSSRGLREFTDYLDGYLAEERFQKLRDETVGVQAALHKIRYTVHIEGLKVHVEKYTGQNDYSQDIAGAFDRFASQSARNYHVLAKSVAEMNHVEEQILECVAKLYPDEFGQLTEFCAQHHNYLDATISRFDREVSFYLSYVKFMRSLTDAGLSFSYPRISDDPGSLSVEDAFDLALAIKMVKEDKTLVCNDVHLSGAERIFVVTGPNQGGKTTYARTIGQLAYLAALGCPVPGRRATLPLPDAIYTHFERQETLATLRGKLDNELVRIHDILSRATADSIIVLNESFSSTTVDDSLLIGTEVLQRIIALGCVAVYVTFLDELASLDPACVSMVAEVAADDPSRRTFQIAQRPADGLAYAAALADKYGLRHDTLLWRISR